MAACFSFFAPLCKINQLEFGVLQEAQIPIKSLNFNAVGLQNSLRKVFGVECDDGVGMANNGGGHDMPVVRVWQLDAVDQFFVARHQAVGHAGVL